MLTTSTKNRTNKADILAKISLNSKYLSREEAAAYASVSVDTIDDLRKKGYIKWGKNNNAKCGKVWILKTSLEEYIMGCFHGGNRV